MNVRRSDKEDYLLRIIRQIAEMIARVREQIVQSTVSKVEAQAQIQASIGTLLGRDAPVLDSLDAESGARLVGDRQRVELWAELLELDAQVLDANGDASLATQKKLRAAALREAATSLPR